MTTVVCRINEMASDSRAIDCNGLSTTCKIWMTPVGILGVAGVAHHAFQLANWLIADRRDEPPNLEGTVALLCNGESIFAFDECVHYYELTDPFAAIGSGAQAAMAAMHLGCTVKEAVKIAKKIDPGSGGKIQRLYI